MKFFPIILFVFCLTNSKLYAAPFRLVAADNRIMSKEFSELGEAYQHRNLIWSYGSESLMTFNEAQKFCEDKKARLPTIEEWEQLYAAPAPSNLLHFNNIFWSLSLGESSDGTYSIKTFYDHGYPTPTVAALDTLYAVRCVIELTLDDLEKQLKELDEEIKELQKKQQTMDAEIKKEIATNKVLEKRIQKLQRENKKLAKIIEEKKLLSKSYSADLNKYQSIIPHTTYFSQSTEW